MNKEKVEIVREFIKKRVEIFISKSQTDNAVVCLDAIARLLALIRHVRPEYH